MLISIKRNNYIGSFLDRGRVLADHILVPLYLANIFSLFTLPTGGYSTWEVLRFIFASTATLISITIWFFSFLISTGWHERGHFIKSIKATVLKKNAGLKNDLSALENKFAGRKNSFFRKILFKIGFKIKNNLLQDLIVLRAGIITGEKRNFFKNPVWNIRYFFYNLKIIFLSPLGLCPGIIRKGLNYYIDAPFDLGVAAEGPKTSRTLGFIGVILAIILIPLGRIYFIPLIVNFGRLFLGLGVVGMLDSFFADPGKWKEYREREKLAHQLAGEVKPVGAWIEEAAKVKSLLQNSRIQEVIRKGQLIRVPWQFRNSGMGGRHTEKEYPESNISMQETMFIPLSVRNYEDAQEMTIKLQTRLKEVIENAEGCRVMGIGLEGGLAPYISKSEGDLVPEQRLWRMAKQTIEECGYVPGKDVVIALDPAASELEIAYREEYELGIETVGMYRFWRATEKVDMSRDELFELYRKTIEEDDVPIISIEDGFAEDDDAGWSLLMDKLGEKLFIIGDDSVTTKDSSIEYAADNNLNNTFLCKANQIGTLSETLLAIMVALGKGLDIVVSHRSKSPNDDIEAQISLAAMTLGLKAGGGANTERLFKYGSIMKIMARAVKEAQENIIKIKAEDKTLEQSAEELVSGMEITGIFAWEEATNAGIPTVGIELSFGIRGSKRFHDFFTFKGSTPLGTSAGTDEAIHLVDSVIYADQIPNPDYFELFNKVSDGSYRFKKEVTSNHIAGFNDRELSELYRRSGRYGGKGCWHVVDHVNTIFTRAFVGKTIRELSSLAKIDSMLLSLELELAEKRGQRNSGSKSKDLIGIMQRKGNLGMNAILSQSLALARLISHMQGRELWEILRETIKETLAKTIANNGGIKIFSKEIIQKLKLKENIPIWQNLSEQLDFGELVSGIQQVNHKKAKDVKLFELLRKNLPIYETTGKPQNKNSKIEDLKTEFSHKIEETKAKLEKVWVLANHVTDSFCEAFIFSVLSLPHGQHSALDVLKFIFYSYNTILTVAIWFSGVVIAIGWHEKAHFIKAIKATVLKKNIGLFNDLEIIRQRFDEQKHNFVRKFFFAFGMKIKDNLLSDLTELRDDIVKSGKIDFIKNPGWSFRYFFFNIKVVIFGPFGLCPGIVKKSFTYYVDAPFDLGVAAEGPRKSRFLGLFGLGAALITVPIGLIFHLPGFIIAGRFFLSFGEMGTLDSFFADPGKWKEFRERERLAHQLAGEVKPAGAWIEEAAKVKSLLQNSRIQEVIRKGQLIRVPWQFRNSGMGGRHTEKEYPESNISMQETMFIPLSVRNYEDAQEMTIKLQTRLKEVIENAEGCRVMGIGLEGGLAPYISKSEGDLVPEQRLWRMAKQTIEECGYVPGKDVVIALDPAASELEIAYREEYELGIETVGMYRFWRATEKVDMSRDELFELYRKTIEEDDVPIISIEDGFAEDDDAGWSLLMDKLGEKLFIIGDDSVTTKDSSIEYAADNNLNNTFLCKANQIGTLSETLLAIMVALGKGLDIVVSHRSKSPNDDMEAQIALSAATLGLKAGGGANTERLFKYGSIMKIMARAVKESQEVLIQMRESDRKLEQSAEELVNGMEITGIFAWEEATNAGIPTVGIELSFGIRGSKRFHNFFTFKGSTPLGTSAGTGEAIHLVDSVIYGDQVPKPEYFSLFDKTADSSYRFKKEVTSSQIAEFNDPELSELYRRSQRYGGKGCLHVVDHVNTIFSKAFIGKKVTELSSLAEIDRLLLSLELELSKKRGQLNSDAKDTDLIDIMQGKGNLGMNAILSQSLSLARLISSIKGKDLFEVLKEQMIVSISELIIQNDSIQILQKIKEKQISDNQDFSNIDLVLEKIKSCEQEKELWKILTAELSFENLSLGLKILEENKKEEIPIYEILRKQLPVYKID